MFEEKVLPEQAEAEVNSWLDAKRVSNKKREAYKDAIDTLVNSVVYGTLSIGEDKIVHNLLFPLEGFAKTLEYKSRITIENYQARMKGISAGDADGRIMAIIGALTETGKGLLTKLDTEDYSVAQAIAIFFL